MLRPAGHKSLSVGVAGEASFCKGGLTWMAPFGALSAGLWWAVSSVACEVGAAPLVGHAVGCRAQAAGQMGQHGSHSGLQKHLGMS